MLMKSFFLTALLTLSTYASALIQENNSAEASNDEVLQTASISSIPFISRTNPELVLSETPMEFVYKEKLGNQVDLFQRYAQFFLITKAKGNKALVENILENESDFLKYYEAILRGLNQYYTGDKKIALEMFEKVYDKAHERLRNSFEGMVVQNILIKERVFDKANLVDENYCYVLLRLTDRKACLANATFLEGIKNSNKYINLLLELEQFNDKGLINFIQKEVINVKNIPTYVR